MIDPHHCDGKGCLCNTQTGSSGHKLKPLGRVDTTQRHTITEGTTRGGGGAIKQPPVNNTPHTHVDEKGQLVTCYHECKSIIRQPSFWVITTLSFPIEHGLWSLIYSLFGWGH